MADMTIPLRACFLLCFSTIAATAVARQEMATPMPILCLKLSPGCCRFGLCLERNGTMTLSYKANHIVRERSVKTLNEPAGTLKCLVRLVLIKVAWVIQNDC